MNLWLVAGLLACMVALIVGQVIQARAFLHLTSDQRNQVTTFRSSRSAHRVITVVGLALCLFMIIALVAAIRLPLPLGRGFVWVLMAVMFAPALWGHATYVRGLRASQVPEPYVAAARRARLVMYAGCLPIVLAVLYVTVTGQ